MNIKPIIVNFDKENPYAILRRILQNTEDLIYCGLSTICNKYVQERPSISNVPYPQVWEDAAWDSSVVEMIPMVLYRQLDEAGHVLDLCPVMAIARCVNGRTSIAGAMRWFTIVPHKVWHLGEKLDYKTNMKVGEDVPSIDVHLYMSAFSAEKYADPIVFFDQNGNEWRHFWSQTYDGSAMPIVLWTEQGRPDTAWYEYEADGLRTIQDQHATFMRDSLTYRLEHWYEEHFPRK